jgi:hypothetical protein
VPFSQPKTPYGLAWDRTRTSAVTGLQLTAWVMAWTLSILILRWKIQTPQVNTSVAITSHLLTALLPEFPCQTSRTVGHGRPCYCHCNRERKVTWTTYISQKLTKAKLLYHLVCHPLLQKTDVFSIRKFYELVWEIQVWRTFYENNEHFT